MGERQPSAVRRLGSGASVFALTSVFRTALSFILLPVLAAVVSPDDYGRLALVSALTGAVGIVAGLGLELSVFRVWFAHEADEDRRSALSTHRWMVVVGAAAVGGAMLGTTASGLLDGLAPRSWIMVALVGTTANAVAASFVAPLLRASRRLAAFGSLHAVAAVVQGGLQLFLLLVLDRGAFGWLLGAAIAAVGMATVGIGVTKHQVGTVAFESEAARGGLRLGLPMLPHGFAHWALSASDRFVLGVFTTTAVVGQYSLAYSLATFVQLAVTEVNRALMVEFGSLLSDPSRSRASILSYLQVTGAVLLGTWAVVLGPPLVVLLFPPSYRPAADLLPWIVPGVALYGIYLVSANLLSIVAGRTGALWPNSVLAALGNLGANLLLVPSFGARGAAVGTVVGYALLVTGTSVAVARVPTLRIDPPTALSVAAVVGTVVIGGVASAAIDSHTAGGLLGRMVVLLPTLLAPAPLLRRLAREERVPPSGATDGDVVAPDQPS